MSFGKYVSLIAAGDETLTAIPVFPSRIFRQSSIYVRRDSGLKDFGNLIPEHGGILDRVDSFVWTAPYSWLVLSYVIPALKAFSLR